MKRSLAGKKRRFNRKERKDGAKGIDTTFFALKGRHLLA